MPIFDYRCDACDVTEERFVHSYKQVVTCECGAVKTKLFTGNIFVDVFPNGGLHLKNVCNGGKTFHSRGEMKRYARENNLELGALL